MLLWLNNFVDSTQSYAGTDAKNSRNERLTVIE
jgi:hypothetical protein